MNWKYNNPKFEYEEKFQDLSWPWSGHKFFAYDLVSNIKPSVIVELGTHYGTSLWSFCQAVKDNKLQTKIFSVDTWKGEKHAGFYGEEVFETVNDIKDKYYNGVNLNLRRMTFDDALKDFEDNSIDVLHIDGLHTYEAVKHDFENWIPKVKEGGIILLHDVVVSRDDFGVYKLWNELKNNYKTIEFQFSYGLGVLMKGDNSIYENKNELTNHYAYFLSDFEKEELNKKDFVIKQTAEVNNLKQKEIEEIKKIAEEKETIITEKEEEIKILNQTIKQNDQEILSKNKEINSKNNELSLIYSSRAWKLVVVFRKILAVLIPVGSYRRKIAGYFFRFFKINTKKIEEQRFFNRNIFYLFKRLIIIFKKDGFMGLVKKIIETALLKNKIFYKFKILGINSFSKKNNKINFTIGKEKLSVVVLTLNRVNDTRKAIKYLYKNIPFDFELIILDNGSDKETINFLKGLKPTRGSLKIIYEKENLGCAGGRKKAFALATGDYILSLDNDIFVMPFSVENLISTLRDDRKIAGACCKVVFPNGKIQFNGGDYDIQNKLIDFSLIDADKKYNGPMTFEKKICGWIPGGATIWRKEILDSFEIDSEMKGSYEDNDFAFILKKEGLHLSNSPKSIVVHNHIGFNRAARKDSKYMSSRYSKDRILYAIRTFYLKHGLLINDPIFYSLIGLSNKNLKEMIKIINKKSL